MRPLAKYIAVVWLCLLGVERSTARPPEWFDERMDEISRIDSLPVDQRIERLGVLVGIGVRSDLDEEQRQVFLAARSSLLSIPGHAGWFGSRIRRITDDAVAGNPNPYHSHQRGWDFQVLGLLRSPESVGVLGELLFDERNPFKDVHSDAPWSPNSANAAYTLSGMNIVGRPSRGDLRTNASDLRAWQLWFEQVRAGTRTFSFEDDPAIYSLSGSVDRVLDPEVTHPRRSAPTSAADPNSNPNSTRATWIWALLLAVLTLAIAARRAFPTRKRS